MIFPWNFHFPLVFCQKILQLFEEKLEAALLTNRVVCIHGETGSGKSTQVPQYLGRFIRDISGQIKMRMPNIGKKYCMYTVYIYIYINVVNYLYTHVSFYMSAAFFWWLRCDKYMCCFLCLCLPCELVEVKNDYHHLRDRRKTKMAPFFETFQSPRVKS